MADHLSDMDVKLRHMELKYDKKLKDMGKKYKKMEAKYERKWKRLSNKRKWKRESMKLPFDSHSISALDGLRMTSCQRAVLWRLEDGMIASR